MAVKIDAILRQIFLHRLKNSDFILENKMAKLNQNEKLKQPDLRDAVSKLYFTLETNGTAQLRKLFTRYT